MDQTLRSFLLELATDPRKLAEYLRDRESYLAGTGLPPEVCAAILSGDQEKVVLYVGVTITCGQQKNYTPKKTRAMRKRASRKATRKKR